MKQQPIERAFTKQFHVRQRADIRATGASLTIARDAGRQACYDWENRMLRPREATLDRRGCKGLARLACKRAIAQLEAMGLITDEATRKMVRSSFTAAFTTENAGHCWGGSAGVYFARWGWTRATILHEVAHWADSWNDMLLARGGERVQHWGHGPQWRGWFLWLLTEVEWAGHKYDLAALKATFPGSIRMPNSMH